MTTNTKNTTPFTTPLNRDEMIRLTREGMENSMRFFMNMNESLMKITEWQRDTINEATQKNVELMNKTYEEYQTHNRVLMSRIETICREASNTMANKGTTETKEKTHNG